MSKEPELLTAALAAAADGGAVMDATCTISFAERWRDALGDAGASSSCFEDFYAAADQIETLEALSTRLCEMDAEAMSQARAEEVEALTAMYGDDLERDGEVIKIRLDPLACRVDDGGGAWMLVSLPPEYPALPPVLELESHDRLSTARADELYDRLLTLALGRSGEPVLHELVAAASAFVGDRLAEKLARETALAERMRAWALPRPARRPAPPSPPPGPEAAGGAGAAATSAVEAAGDPDAWEWEDEGEFSYEDARPASFVGPLHAIVARLPPAYAVARVECVLRPDLARRTRRLWAAFRRAYGAQGAAAGGGPALKYGEPTVTYHGTRLASISSIVRSGLLLPGKRVASRFSVGVYGAGIYSSPRPEVALGYVESDARGSFSAYRLLVCATLMGRPCLLTGAAYDAPLRAGYDSHISPCMNEYVVMNEAQILPVYVLTLVSRDELPAAVAGGAAPALGLRAQIRQQAAAEEAAATGMELARRRLERLEARARKFLPYGFGPSERLHVLEAAPDSDSDGEDAELSVERWADPEEWEPARPAPFPPKSGKPKHRQKRTGG